MATRMYQAELEPKKQQLRMDPFDSQSGEIERSGAEYPFTIRQHNGDADLISDEEC